MQTRTLSVKNMVYDDGAISRLVEELKKVVVDGEFSETRIFRVVEALR